MLWETAKKAIDYLIANSQDSTDLGVSFYGGEPLLEFEFIKKCIIYAEAEAEGRQIKFNFTTNGTLLSKEKFNFLIEHDVAIMMSLDGPKEVHDKKRKFGNGKGSFELIVNNLTSLKEYNKEYFAKKISFNTVIDPAENNLKIINDFLKNDSLFTDMIFKSTLIDNRNYKKEYMYNEDFLLSRSYEIFKIYLWKLGRINKRDVSPLFYNYVSEKMRFSKMLEDYEQDEVPDIAHRSGPCYPGVRKFFVSCEGNIYPCERISEISKATLIGNINTGIDLQRALEMLNIEKLTSEKCRKCWLYFLCNNCIGHMDDGNDISLNMLCKNCESNELV